VVYVGGEKVDDVTTHPAFRNAARSMAAIYDLKASKPEFSFTEDGEKYSAYFLRAKSRDDLVHRMNLHRAIADMSHGLLGRSPDHVSSFVTGMAMNPLVFGKFADNLTRYYEHMRQEDVYGVYAVIPPQAARNPEFYVKQNLPIPTLRVVREDHDGVVISGMKMLATGAVFANEIWIGNLIPLAPNQLAESITCAIPVNAAGVTLWSRKPFERDARNEFDSPLAWRFDESDSMVMCEEVKVPWERVFVHNDAVLARDIYIKTPGHCYGNHQSNVRFHSKMQLIVGLASKIAQASGANEIPAVREVLGRFSALEAALGGMIAGQIQDAEDWPKGFKTFNRRYMYAALNWCTESHSQIIDALRELCGGGIFQMPADITVMHDDKLKAQFETYWQTPQLGAVERMKLYKLAWDLIGSEFAGRHLQYEKFYAGASFIVRNHNFREAPWDQYHKVVEDLMASYGVPAK
jgi:4-hydroxyphenylacetate 3-monooxygenase